jgi:hypothetical protein
LGSDLSERHVLQCDFCFDLLGADILVSLRPETQGITTLPTSPEILVEVLSPYNETVLGAQEFRDKLNSAFASGTKVCPDFT